MTILTESVKRTLYKQGLYSLPRAPKADSSKWTLAKWIKFIDENGTWNTK
ncbi:hypothetical protein ESCO47_00089 [Escherichia phage vB_EcoM_ESCO47]|nr:hypothetical protein ESCO47_00089 [Escherichia phage vB_EcoM_ESCO47]